MAGTSVDRATLSALAKIEQLCDGVLPHRVPPSGFEVATNEELHKKLLKKDAQVRARVD